MGFTPKLTEYQLSFPDGHPLAGFTCAVRGLTVGELITKLDAQKTYELFISRVIEWNLEDDQGQPVPVTLESFSASFDLSTAESIVGAWLRAATKVTPFLLEPSKDGESRPVENFPMAPMSSDQPSSNGQSSSTEYSGATPDIPTPA